MARMPAPFNFNSIANAPKTMLRNTESDLFYKEIIKACITNKTITPSDLITLGFAAEQYYIYSAAQLELYNQETGQLEIIITQTGDRGQDRKIQNPAIKIMNDAYKNILDVLKEYGLTPKARKQVEALEAETESLLHKLMQGADDD